jgi:hypothetical protein
MTLFSSRQRWKEGALLGGLEITGPQGRAGWTPRETRDDREHHAEAGSSPSSEAPLDHVVRQGFGRAGGVEAAISGESRWRR